MKTYDPGLISMSIGPMPVTGYAAGTFVKASRKTETFKDQVGATGEVVRVRSRDRRGSIELVLLRTSLMNDYLSDLLAQDEDSGTGVVPITIKDLNGTTRVFGAECWLTKPADVEEAEEAQHRTWTFAVANFETYVGGSVV